MKCLPSRDARVGTPSMIRLPFQVPKPCWLTVYVLICWFLVWGFFWNLEEMYPWLIWRSLFWQDIKNCVENHASLEQFLRVIWEAVFWAMVLSVAQIKLFSVPIIGCLLIIFIGNPIYENPYLEVVVSWPLRSRKPSEAPRRHWLPSRRARFRNTAGRGGGPAWLLPSPTRTAVSPSGPRPSCFATAHCSDGSLTTAFSATLR